MRSETLYSGSPSSPPARSGDPGADAPRVDPVEAPPTGAVAEGAAPVGATGRGAGRPRLVSTVPGALHGLASLFCLVVYPFVLATVILHLYRLEVLAGPVMTLVLRAYFVLGAASGLVALTTLPVWSRMYTSTPARSKGLTTHNIRRTHQARMLSFTAFSLAGAWFVSPLLVHVAWLLVPVLIWLIAIVFWLRNCPDRVGVLADAGGGGLLVVLFVLAAGPGVFVDHPQFRSMAIFNLADTSYLFTYAYFFYFLATRSYISEATLRAWIRPVHVGAILQYFLVIALTYTRYGLASLPWIYLAILAAQALFVLTVLPRSVRSWK